MGGSACCIPQAPAAIDTGSDTYQKCICYVLTQVSNDLVGKKLSL